MECWLAFYKGATGLTTFVIRSYVMLYVCDTCGRTRTCSIYATQMHTRTYKSYSITLIIHCFYICAISLQSLCHSILLAPCIFTQNPVSPFGIYWTHEKYHSARMIFFFNIYIIYTRIQQYRFKKFRSRRDVITKIPSQFVHTKWLISSL